MKKLIITLFVLVLSPIVINAQHIGIGFGNHTIAAKSDGTVYTWGNNSYGQLGNGNTTNSNVPIAVVTSGALSGKTITKVAAGLLHSVALASDGTVYTWGYNYYGQLGRGNTTDSNVPVAVSTSGALSGKTITQVATGLYHSIALASDGTVYTWGYNNRGQLGNGNTGTNSNVPVAVSTSGTPMEGKTITHVSAGNYHSIALASDGTVYTWGRNIYGQLGNNSNTDSNVPVAVSTSGVLSDKTITQVDAGAYHSIALASDGTVYTWGRNLNGQLGNGNNTDSNVPVAVDTSGVLSGKTITQVATGNYHSIALASDGAVYIWGRNDYGQLGKGTNTDSNVPVAVSTSGALSGKTITQVATGTYHSIALASDGTVYTWGRNNYGQLGNGTNTDSNIPVAVLMEPLPVELTSFSANFLTDRVELNWQTATEVNNYGFEVQRQKIKDKSEDDWENIGFVQGHGTSNSPKQYSFTDTLNLTLNPNLTLINYRLKQIDNDGTFAYSKIITVDLSQVTGIEEEIPAEFSLSQNYPNPFNPTTTIQYSIPKTSFVSLKIYDVLGKEVASLVNEELSAGVYNRTFNAANLSSGIYFYTLRANNFTATKKLMLVK